MKLIVQIPCFNEEHTLPATVADVPTSIDGIDEIQILIIDDGSSDRTVEVARELGVDHIVQNKQNLGLARTFKKGIEACLAAGADVIVNTDGDNQYCGADIAKLVQPIVTNEADIAIGDRDTTAVAHFSTGKKILQKLGSFVVRKLSDVNVPDAVSGFRAFSRDAALQLNVVSSFSYTIETIIQAGKKHLTVASVKISTNPKTRESRLFSSIPQFIGKSLTTMLRIYSMYQPLRVFLGLSVILMLAGAVPIVRFLLFFLISGDGTGHVQSLVLGGALMIIGYMTLIAGLVADLISFNRQLIELTLHRVRILELRSGESSKETLR